MVAEAVRLNRSPMPNFPANRENYRELFKIGHPKRLLVRENSRDAATSVSIPYAK